MVNSSTGEREIKSMEEKSLAVSLVNSFGSEVSSCVGEIAEIGLDAILEDGMLKEIPFISTAMSIYRMGKSIHERHNIAKLVVFLNEINQGTADETEREKYYAKFKDNERFRSRELEYILILIDRYIDYDKPVMLAKLYLAYLREFISWHELTMYAEAVDRFLIGDEKLLYVNETAKVTRKHANSGLARLTALGLMIENITWAEVSGETLNLSNGEECQYELTPFGRKLANILC